MKLISWNVNGIRAVFRKGFYDWLLEESPDILCVQETKADGESFPQELQELKDYHLYLSAAEKKGYSGVAIFSKLAPIEVKHGFGIPEFDSEGRILIASYPDFILYNIYYPNGKSRAERLRYKMNFYDAFLAHVKTQKKSKPVIVCGDVNTAHQSIDLARPAENKKYSGFLPEERAWIDTFLANGFIDTFRVFHKAADHYTWWDYKTRARERNIGWRIDYFFASRDCIDKVQDAYILKNVMGSDHCPVGIDVNF